MYILTKRATDGKQVWHTIHGMSENPNVARAWYRSTRTTDVFDLNRVDWNTDLISETKLESWREQHARESLEAAKQRQANGVE